MQKTFHYDSKAACERHHKMGSKMWIGDRPGYPTATTHTPENLVVVIARKVARDADGQWYLDCEFRQATQSEYDASVREDVDKALGRRGSIQSEY
jgi:hypothetical protein